MLFLFSICISITCFTSNLHSVNASSSPNVEMHEAAREGERHRVHYWIINGASPENTNSRDRTPLHSALYSLNTALFDREQEYFVSKIKDYKETIMFLVGKAPQTIGLRDDNNRTPLDLITGIIILHNSLIKNSQDLSHIMQDILGVLIDKASARTIIHAKKIPKDRYFGFRIMKAAFIRSILAELHTYVSELYRAITTA